jgi:Rod binding domain-containing protein
MSDLRIIMGASLSGLPTTPLNPQTTTPDDPVHAKLRQAADGLNGMFIRQLFSAMRATVPTDADGLSSAGGTVFTQMLDDTIADHAAGQMRRGLGDAIYRELCARLTSSGGSGQ